MSQPPRNKVGATPGKLALVGLLSIVLIAVLASNFLGETAPEMPYEPQPTVVPTGAVHAPEAAATGVGAESPFGKFAADRPWPRMTLQEMTNFDPLATAAWAAPAPDIQATAEREHGAEQLNQLRSAQNAIIITAGEKRMARIGEYEFQVGDTVGDFRITDITPAGVVLSKIE